MTTSRRSLLAAALAAGALPSWRAGAQSGPVRIVVGFPAGGTLDAIARRLADQLRGKYGGEVVLVEQKVGAGGRIANDVVKNAPADGATMVLSPSSPMVIFPHVYSKLSYDPQRDFVPVTPVCSNAQTFVVGPAVPESVRTLAQYLAWTKANPVGASYGTPAAGSIMHFQGTALAQKAGLEMTHIAYRGMAPIVPELLGGNLPASMAVTGDITQHVASGKLRALAVTSEKRSRFLPTVPTFAELGYPEVTGVDWYGIFLPARTPPAIAQKLHQLILAGVAQAPFAGNLDSTGFDGYTLSQEEFARRIRDETTRWGPVVKASGFKPEAS